MNIKKLLSNVFSAVAIIIILLIIISLFPVTGNYKILVVQSGSMEPNIHTGSVVVVKPQMSYQEGDVITFRSKGGKLDSVTHRLMKIEESGSGRLFMTKGDANDTNDAEPVSSERVIGKVLFSVPYFGYAVAAAKQPLGFLAIVLVPTGIIIIEEIFNIIKEMKRMKAEKAKKTAETENKEEIVNETEEDESESEE